jgi:hypothetical protein
MKRIIKPSTLVLFVLWAILQQGCSYSVKFTDDYYRKHQTTLHDIRERYEQLYSRQPFNLDLKNKELTRIGIELLTDTMKYIYNFTLDDLSFVDTLVKYKLDVVEMSKLIRDMQTVQATWISKLDYFVNRERKYLIFMSVRHRKLSGLLKPERYFTLAFFNNPQLYDRRGRLLDKDDQKTHRRINGEIFRRLNDRLFYAVMDRYR